MKKFILLFATLTLFFVTACLTADATSFFVGMYGSDSNPGTRSKPFARLDEARDAARNTTLGKDTIVILPGEYFLSKTFELDAMDNDLTIMAEQNGTVTIYGGVRVNGWSREGDKFWSAYLPEVKAGSWDFRSVIINGQMTPRARIPENDTFQHLSEFKEKWMSSVGNGWARKPTDQEYSTMKYKSADIPENLDVRNAEIRVYHMWDESLVGVAGNNTQTHVLTFSNKPTHPPGGFGKQDYIVFNTREGMTKPGLWYLDRTNGKLVYWPLEGDDMAKANVMAPKIEKLVNISGEKDKPVKGIFISGIKFQSAGVPLKTAGFAGVALDAAISLENAENCILQDLEVCNVAGVGVSMRNTFNCKFDNSLIHHTGAAGLSLRGTNNLLANTHIHHTGVYFPSSAGIVVSGNSQRIFRNAIHDVPYCGIICSGNVKGVFEENEIYRVMRELHDGAAIYGIMTNVVMKGNYVHDLTDDGKGYGISAYYLDEGSYDCLVEGNVSIGVITPTHNHIAEHATYRNNVFVSDSNMIISFPKSAKCIFEWNKLIVKKGTLNKYMNQANAFEEWRNNIIYTGEKIDTTMPSNPKLPNSPKNIEIKSISKVPVIDGTIAADEFPAAVYSLDRNLEGHVPSGALVTARFTYSKEYLYVGITTNMFRSSRIVSGSKWGNSDGVEIRLEGRSGNGKPCIYLLRGYVDGEMQSINDAGASDEAAITLGKLVKFAVKNKMNKGMGLAWQIEWAIPFKNLGFKPMQNSEIPFNIRAFVNEYGNWHCWEAENKNGKLILK